MDKHILAEQLNNDKLIGLNDRVTHVGSLKIKFVHRYLHLQVQV